MSAKSAVMKVMRNAAGMASGGHHMAWKRYFGGNRAMARMRRGIKTAASSARRRLEKALGKEDYENE